MTGTEPHEAWTAPPTPSATEADRGAVVACVRDYYGGWFEGDSDRMARALHPELRKRSFGQGPRRTPELNDTSFDEMVAGAASGWGVARAGDRLDIRICDIGAGIASAVAYADHYVDYLHLIETPEGWKIINAVWRWADGHGPRA